MHTTTTTTTGEALKANITTLGPLVLPLSEQLLFAANMVARRILGRRRFKPYVPDFNTAFQHVCIHTGEWPDGGRRAVIVAYTAVQPSHMQPHMHTQMPP